MSFPSTSLSFLLAATVAALVAGGAASPASGQDGLVAGDSLGSLLPAGFGEYVVDQVSIPPAFGDDPESVTANVLYREAEGDRSPFFIGLTQYLPGARGGAFHPRGEPTTFAGHPAYRGEDPGVVTVWVGRTLELTAYPSSGDVELSSAELLAVLEHVDLAPIVALDARASAADAPAADGAVAVEAEAVEGVVAAEEIGAVEEAVAESEAVAKSEAGAVAESEAEAVAKAVAAEGPPMDMEGVGDGQSCDFSAELRDRLRDEWSMGQVAPWTHALTAERAETSERSGDLIVFPKAANDWLPCVTRNDLLWSPLSAARAFLVRVLEIEERPRSVVFRVEDAGLGALVQRGRVEIEAGDEEASGEESGGEGGGEGGGA